MNGRLLVHWARMLSGRSYYHVPQGIGRAFVPGRLRGYFNDLTGKADWSGITDASAIPMNQLLDGRTCYFATTIVQKALGHHDRYLLAGRRADRDAFLRLCVWLVDQQDGQGGWDVSDMLRLPRGFRYSAMPQGEAVSALLRAYEMTDDVRFMVSAEKALHVMLTPVEQGGTGNYAAGGLTLEECPSMTRNTILNGWVFALFGIYDFCLATGDAAHSRTFTRSLGTLANELGRFDAGYWSYYDQQGALASPFYHDLHISQLRALHMASGLDDLQQAVDRWEAYRQSRVNKTRAFVRKAYQKVKQPPAVVIVR